MMYTLTVRRIKCMQVYNYLFILLQRAYLNTLLCIGNLAIIFAPNFMHARVETIEITISDAPHTKSITTSIIRDCDYFFSMVYYARMVIHLFGS